METYVYTFKDLFTRNQVFLCEKKRFVGAPTQAGFIIFLKTFARVIYLSMSTNVLILFCSLAIKKNPENVIY